MDDLEDFISHFSSVWKTTQRSREATASIVSCWQAVQNQIKAYSTHYKKCVNEFVELRQEVHACCVNHLYCSVWLLFPAVNLLPSFPGGPSNRLIEINVNSVSSIYSF